MKIRELLEADEGQKIKKPASNLPSINDEPEELDDIEDDDSEIQKDEVKKFSDIGAKFGPDLYSFSSIEYGEDWNARNATSLAQKLGEIDLDGIDSAISDMRSASGRDGGMTFIVLNGRSGEVVSAGFGSDAISDGIVMDTLDPDQSAVIDRINSLNTKYINAGGGVDDESDRNFKIRQHILSLLNYDNQSVKTDKAPLDWGNLRPSEDALKKAAGAFKARREARKLRKQS